MNNKSKANNFWGKRAIFFVIFALFFIFPALNDLSNLNTNGFYAVDTGYEITQYHTDIVVNENNTLNVSEEITVNFLEERQGIIRSLPLFQKVTYEDNNGKAVSKNYRLEITDVNANVEKQLNIEDGFLLIRLGTAGEYQTSSKTYNISYTVNLGDDRISSFDQFYYNPIGHDWDTTISNASVNITFFKPIEPQKEGEDFLNLYYGKIGATTGGQVSGNAEKTVFTYNHLPTLGAFEGLTFRVVLKADYFKAKTNFLFDILFAIGFVIIAIIGFISFKKNTNKKVFTPVVNFTPPKQLPPSELGYIIDGKVDAKDIASLVVYWANKGYLQIIEDEKDKNNFTLAKVKDTDENMQDYEKQIFTQMFKDGDKIKLPDIGEKIHSSVISAKTKIEKKHKEKNFNQKAINTRDMFAVLSAFVLGLVAHRVGQVAVVPILRIIGVGLAALWYFVLLALIRRKDNFFKKSKDYNKSSLWLTLALTSIIGALFICATAYAYAPLVFLPIVALVVLLLFSYGIETMTTRTDEGLDLLGEVVGFKQFITLTETDRIAMLAKENPEMFYEILPYAYVLGVSDEWIDKFSSIALTPPQWLVSSSNLSVFDYLVFRSLFNNLMLSSRLQSSYMPVTNSSGRGFGGGSGGSFGGGGGFSGGGFGGGGGRSW